MEDLVKEGRGKEKKKNELQKVEKQGRLPGIVLKGVFLAVAVGLMPFLHKHSLTPHLMGYANHATIARSWELFNLFLIALAISYGLISRRHTPTDTDNENDKDIDREQGAQNYVQKIFDFAEVFDNLEKVEAWSSRWQPQEPVVVIDKEKPLLLPIRSLKSTLSNPEVFDFLKDAAVDAEENGKRAEVRNGIILSVESANFEEEVSSNVIVDEVFSSPIPWASRLGKEPLPAAIDPPAIPSPIPWRSRPDRENGAVSDSKPPLPPPQRPPPPAPQMPNRSPSPSPSSNAPSQKNMQPPSAIPLHKPPSPSPSPSNINLQESPAIPLPNLPSNPAVVESGSSQSQNNPTPKPEENNSAKDPSVSTVAESGSSVKHHSNGSLSIPKSPVPPPPVLQECPQPKEQSGNATNSHSRGKGRECSSRRRSKIRETSSDSSRGRGRGREGEEGSTRLASPVPPPLYPDESAPLPPPPPYSDDELSYENTSSSSELLYQMEDSFSETEEEVDKKADQFIAKFHEQIRMQRVESMRRHERKGDQ